MCNRHVPHLIAEYEASKREGAAEGDAPEEASRASARSDPADADGVVASLVARLTR